MERIWVNKVESFDAAERFEKKYYKSLSTTERLETVQFLRETYFKSSGKVLGENGKRLRRVLSSAKQIQGPYGEQTVNFIDRKNLIKSKKISSRSQDKTGLERLQETE